jgi:glycosyltransferase involved in cell wall biosynthesis
MAEPNLSIAISILDDWRVHDCLASIDFPAEVLIFVDKRTDKKLIESLKKYNFRIVSMERFSFSKFYNLGISESSKNKIFFMDSDCVFIKGALSKLYNHSNSCSIAKARVRFDHNSWLSKIISKAREFTTSDSPNLYIPGPIFDKEVFDKVGKFDENMHHTVDNYMSQKIIREGLDWKYFNFDIILHAPLTIKEDLRSAFRYGLGRSKRYKLEKKNNPKFFREFLDRLIQGTERKGVTTGIYLSIWSLMLNLGFIRGKYLLKND